MNNGIAVYKGSDFIDPEWIAKGLVIYTRSTDRPFVIESIGRYGLNCSVVMVTYLNMHATADAQPFTRWYLEESLLLKMFYTKNETYNLPNDRTR